MQNWRSLVLSRRIVLRSSFVRSIPNPKLFDENGNRVWFSTKYLILELQMSEAALEKLLSLNEVILAKVPLDIWELNCAQSHCHRHS